MADWFCCCWGGGRLPKPLKISPNFEEALLLRSSVVLIKLLSKNFEIEQLYVCFGERRRLGLFGLAHCWKLSTRPSSTASYHLPTQSILLRTWRELGSFSIVPRLLYGRLFALVHISSLDAFLWRSSLLIWSLISDLVILFSNVLLLKWMFLLAL